VSLGNVGRIVAFSCRYHKLRHAVSLPPFAVHSPFRWRKTTLRVADEPLPMTCTRCLYLPAGALDFKNSATASHAPHMDSWRGVNARFLNATLARF